MSFKYSSVALFSKTLGYLFHSKILKRAITYHEFDTKSKYSVSFKDFLEQIDYLVCNNYSFHCIKDIRGVPQTSKAVFITFDDGHVSSLKAAEYLLSRGIQFTTFLVAKKIENNSDYSCELKNLVASNNFEIGCHSYSHVKLTNVSDVAKDVNTAKYIIENFFGTQVHSFSLPFGKKNSYDYRSLNEIKKAGFEYCCSQIPSPIYNDVDPYLVPRIGIRDEDDLKLFKLKLNGHFDFLKYL